MEKGGSKAWYTRGNAHGTCWSNILGTNKLCFGSFKQVYALCGVNMDWENFQRT